MMVNNEGKITEHILNKVSPQIQGYSHYTSVRYCCNNENILCQPECNRPSQI